MDAIAPGPRAGMLSHISVIIESKGCWHREVRDAMRTQLRDRYLRGNLCRDGLYVVGWYLCDSWDDSDYRKADARRQIPVAVADDAQRLFDEQASDLSGGGVTIKALIIDATLRGDARRDRP